MQYCSPQMTQYYCAIFHFAHRSRQVNTHSDPGGTCVATVSAVFKKGKESLLDHRMVQMRTTTHIKEFYKALCSMSQTTKIFCSWVVQHQWATQDCYPYNAKQNIDMQEPITPSQRSLCYAIRTLDTIMKTWNFLFAHVYRW
jgi:hypothetical protein